MAHGMADLLSVLREYNIKKKNIIDCNDIIIFGNVYWPKDEKINILTHRSNGDKGPREHFTLDSVVFLLKNSDLCYSEYAMRAVERNIPVIEDAVRADVLEYLCADFKSSSRTIDSTGSMDLPSLERNTEDKHLWEESFDMCVPHLGETLVNDIKEERDMASQFCRCRETLVHSTTEDDFFQLHHGETIVTDCKKEVSSTGLPAKKLHRLQTHCDIKEDPDVKLCVHEKNNMLGETYICD